MLFRYTIEFWDEIEDVRTLESGIVTGETPGRALDRLVDFYGKEYFINVEEFYELENPISDCDIEEVLDATETCYCEE